ncbi:MAG: hypothetical protein AAGH64_13030, partial [Planctomycetota bacterium]
MLSKTPIILASLFLAAGSITDVVAQPAFTQIRLAAEPIETGVALEARRANAWDEPDGTQRLTLDEDVRLRIAGYDLTADRATIWIAPRDDLAAGSTPSRFVQVFIYAEGVDTPLAEPAVAVTAEDLRIQGVLELTAPLAVAADAIASRPSTGPFDDRAALAFEEALASAERSVPLVEAA